MAEISTTWAQRDYVAFLTGTLSTISSCIDFVQGDIHRGTLSSSTNPTLTRVTEFLTHAKQKLAAKYGFSWRRKYVYATTSAGNWQLALPADYGGGVVTVRDVTDNSGDKLGYIPNATFDSMHPNPSGASSGEPEEYTIKDRELWLSRPADGSYTLELEYPRVGDDSTTTDVSWLPQIARFQICNYAIYRSFLLLQQWDAAQAYKAEWMEDIYDAKKTGGRQKWAEMGYRAVNWQYKRI